MDFLKILLLSIVQGAAELLPVSSSAHVIVAEKLLGLDPAAPAMTLLLVMLHTGTMFAVICYFWSSWKATFFASRQLFIRSAVRIAAATLCTGIVGLGLKALIERLAFHGSGKGEIEMLFGNLGLIAAALAAAGILIVVAGAASRRAGERAPGFGHSCGIGAIQGLCLPFRGFSRSGATISAGLVMGLSRARVEEFSFALAVVLTPPVVARELLRALKAQGGGHPGISFLLPGLAGMALSFLAGLAALRWLSSWLENGRWHLFGFYCLAASAGVFLLYRAGF